MKSQLFCPDATPRAGVLVFPEAFGLGAHAIERAQRLAQEGYAALACDLHGGALVVEDLPTVMGMLAPLFDAPDRTRARAHAALAALSARPEVDAARVAAIGFCFGGTMAFELARSGAAIRAAVGFHSGLGTKAPPSPPGSIAARILACIGAEDPAVPAEQRAGFEAEMRAAAADWQLHIYGNTVHSFTSKAADARNIPHMARYSATADARSWAAMTQLFGEVLGAG